MAEPRVVVIGAGIGGLVTAVLLAARGVPVTVLEAAGVVGGKARRLSVAGAAIDAGPTVFTLRDVFEAIFAEAGSNLASEVQLTPATVLARHSWADDHGGAASLDLHADPAASEAAIAEFAGGGAVVGYRAFRAEARRIYGILDHSFIRAGKVSWPGPLMTRIGLTRIGDLHAIRPYETLWSAVGAHFADPRLRQLFARYATYCGSSPFACPATLMLIADVEAQGVWTIEGGMAALAAALARLARRLGAEIRLDCPVAEITVGHGRANGVITAQGEALAAAAVVCNADPAAIADGRFGAGVARATGAVGPRQRSLAAMVWLAHARTGGFALSHHNVFFAKDYAAEFKALRAGRLPPSPTIYVGALDRAATAAPDPHDGRERLQILINAPPTGDSAAWPEEDTHQWTATILSRLASHGLTLAEPLAEPLSAQCLTPAHFAAAFPSTGGALYGRASHGWLASFLRQGTRTRIPGLFCAGGATHPGAGVPMAALSGRLATMQTLTYLASMRPSPRAATVGGTSMRRAMMAPTPSR